MPWKTKDGKILKEGKSWNDGEFQHPYNWASSWSADDKKRFGISFVEEEDTSFDNRFYWSKGIERKLEDEDAKDEDGKQLYEEDGKTKIVIKGLKNIWIEKTKEDANTILSKTDWLVTRKSEKGTAIPDSTTSFRDSVRTKCAEIETKINACKNLADFMKLFEMPVDSKGKPTGKNSPIYDLPKEI